MIPLTPIPLWAVIHINILGRWEGPSHGAPLPHPPIALQLFILVGVRGGARTGYLIPGCDGIGGLLYVYHGNLILVFFYIFNIKNSIPGSKTYLKMILRLVAPFSQSMSSFRATATHFMPEAINFARSPTTKTHNLDLQNLNFGEYMYCKYKICVLQIQKYCIKAPIIYCKYIIYVLQIQKFCINAPIRHCKYINYCYKYISTCCKYTHLYIANIYICMLQT